MKVQIIKSDLYQALYINGVKIIDGHTISPEDVAEAILGAENVFIINEDDIDELIFDDAGNSFLDEFMIWEIGVGFVDAFPEVLYEYR